MQLHQLKPKHKLKEKKRIGRGGKRGTYSGRGIKGQKARAGRKMQPMIREAIKKYPKLRGYRRGPKKKIQVEVNLTTLQEKFKAGEKVNPKILLQKKLISKIKGRIPEVKILGEGKIKKKLIVEDCQMSKEAGKKIEKVGGEIK